MQYYLTLEKKKLPEAHLRQNQDIDGGAVELELALVTTTDDEPLPVGRFEVIKRYDEIPEAWDSYFPEVLPGGRKGAVKRTGMFFAFSGKADEKQTVITFIEDTMNAPR